MLPDKPPRGSCFAVVRMSHVCSAHGDPPHIVVDKTRTADLEQAKRAAAHVDPRLTPTVVVWRLENGYA